MTRLLRQPARRRGRTLMSFAALVLVLLAGVARASDVLTVTAESFEQDLELNKHVFLGVFAPWCGHCQAMKPAFEEAATRVRGEAVFASMDGADKRNEEILQRLGVKGFPTLKIFVDGKLAENYQGERTADALVNAARRHAGAGVEYLTKKKSKAFLVQCKKANQACALGHALPEGDEASARATFQAVGEQLRSVLRVGILDVKEASKQRFDVHSPFDEPTLQTTDFALPDFGFWVQRAAEPKVVELGAPAFEQYVKRVFDQPSTRVLAIARSAERVKATKATLMGMAHANATYMVATCDNSASACNFFQIKKQDTPAVVVDRTTVDGKKYVKRNVDAAALRAFVDSAIAGHEVPELRASSTADTLQELGDGADHVHPVTATTWDQHMAVALPYVVYVYSHTCPHCKDFTPTLKFAAKTYTEDNSDATPYVAQFLAINGAKNDIPDVGLTVTGFPSVHGRYANGTYVRYEGFRVAEDLVAFARSLASVDAAPVQAGAEAPERVADGDAGGGLCAFDTTQEGGDVPPDAGGRGRPACGDGAAAHDEL